MCENGIEPGSGMGMTEATYVLGQVVAMETGRGRERHFLSMDGERLFCILTLDACS